MPRGPKITQAARSRIIELALENRSVPRMLVVDRAKQQIERLVAYMPTDETIANLISWAWNHEPNHLDSQWSLGESRKHDIPIEANQDLLRIWKWCFLVGRKFTIREAIWVSHLRNLVHPSHVLYLADCYAIRERAAELLREEVLDTQDIDSWLVFRNYEEQADWNSRFTVSLEKGDVWARYTADSGFLGSHGRYETKEQELLEGAMDQESSLSDISRFGLRPSDAILVQENVCDVDEALDRGNILTEDADAVYSLWLRRLIESPKWKDLPMKSKGILVKKLREEIASDSQYLEELRRAQQPDDFDGRREELIHTYLFAWAPSAGILRKVGLDVARRTHFEEQRTYWSHSEVKFERTT